MRNLSWALAALWACIALQVGAARAEVVVLEPVKDNTLYESAAGVVSNGAGSHFFAGRNGQGTVVRGLLKFDLVGSVPVGATVLNATLSLTMSKTNNPATETVSLHRVLEEWGEGTSAGANGEGGGAPATAGDATWVHTFFFNEFWAALGGDFDPAASASTGVTGVGIYSWNSAELTADVQLFLDTPFRNHGWMVAGNEAANAKRFNTRENPGVNSRPQLSIEFEPLWAPALAPPSAALLAAVLAVAAVASLRSSRS